jgi:hypothetical protein
LYSASQVDYSLGRHPVFNKKTIVRKNLLANFETEESCVAAKQENVFRLTNININECNSGLKLGIGHTDYRDNLLLILRFINFRE